MPDEVIIYHHPHCSKSREALELIRRRGVIPRVIDYLKTPPTEEALRALGLPAREIIRENEEEYTRLNLSDPARSDDELFSAIARHPILLQRPIVIARGRALVARPPGRVDELLGKPL